MPSSLRESNSSAVNFFFLLDIITCFTGLLILITLLLATQVNPQAVAAKKNNEVVDPSLQAKLAKLLDELSDLSPRNQTLQKTLTAAEAIPDTSELQNEITELRKTISDKKELAAAMQSQLSKQRKEVDERDVSLGLTDLRHQIEEIESQTQKLGEESKKVMDQVHEYEAKVKEAEARLLKIQNQKNKLWVIPDTSNTTKEPILVTVSEKLISIERFNKPESRKELLRPSSTGKLLDALHGFDPLDFYIVFYVKPSGVAQFDAVKQATQRAGYELGYDALSEATQIVFSRLE